MTNVQNICNLIGREEYNVGRIILWYCNLNNVLFRPPPPPPPKKKQQQQRLISMAIKIEVYKIKK